MSSTRCDKFHHVDLADRDRRVEKLARHPVVKLYLAALGKPRVPEELLDLIDRRAVENGRRRLESELLDGPAEMRLEDLADVHTARHAERIENDLHRRPVRKMRQILLRHDAGNNSLVAVAPGHLVADRHLALARDVDLHELAHARRELVAAHDALAFLFVGALHLLDRARRRLHEGLDPAVDLGVLDDRKPPVEMIDVQPLDHLFGDLAPPAGEHFARLRVDELLRGLADHELRETLAPLFLDMLDLEIALVLKLHEFLLLVALRPVVPLLAGEQLDVDDDTVHARGRLERSVADVSGLLAEYRLQQPFLRRELGFSLRRHLADENVAGFHVGADANDAVLVEVRQHLLAHVRNLAGDLLHAGLRVADLRLELLDMNRREDVFLDELLADDDRVLEVVPAPRHEGDEHVAAERELARFRRGAVRDHLALLDLLPDLDDRLLVDAGILVGTLELDELVLVDAAESGEIVEILVFFLAAVADEDLVRGHGFDPARAPRDAEDARVVGDLALETRSDERRFGLDERHGLPLHVASHEGPVRVVVLEERNKGRGGAHELVRRNVHEMDFLRIDENEIPPVPRHHDGLDELAVLVELGVRVGDDVIVFLVRREHLGLVRDEAVLHLAVRGLEEPVLVDPRVRRERRDEADVRTFGGLDRAHAPVVRVVHVADLEPRALAREAAGAERREAALVRELGERVRLIHELRELARTEERLNDRADRSRVHEIVRRGALRLLDRHALADDPRHARESHGELVRQELADGAHPAIAEMVDVVDRPVELLQLNEVGHDRDEILFGQGRSYPSARRSGAAGSSCGGRPSRDCSASG